MGDIISLSEYREKRKGHPEQNGFSVELAPPYLVVRHYENGMLCREFRTFSEYMLREMLDAVPMD